MTSPAGTGVENECVILRSTWDTKWLFPAAGAGALAYQAVTGHEMWGWPHHSLSVYFARGRDPPTIASFW